MEFIKIDNTDSEEFKEAWELYVSSFPSDERRTLPSQKESLRCPQYAFFRILNNSTFAAIIAVWHLEDFSFIEHFAVKKDIRSKGIGTGSLKEYLSKENKTIVLEVERPPSENASNRITFYEKIGFALNTFEYLQPPYGKGKKPVPLFLMTYPNKISESEFLSIRSTLHTVVYGLKEPHWDE
ncbi:MAG: GNAT family N-acetyltransferase [Nanoarchaeota archaeon]